MWRHACRLGRRGEHTAGDEQRLALVEVHATHGPVMLVETIDECAHAVVPQLDHTAVQRRQDPWSLRVEGQPLHLHQPPSPIPSVSAVVASCSLSSLLATPSYTPAVNTNDLPPPCVCVAVRVAQKLQSHPEPEP
jgi:hypothetical protein